ncbi:SdpI family protein [Leifsonia sp. TF02-11]|uniref:SdpI family protein n=1 Tax=Leifsonia sp. TF02-11 TaxID=2815212 RepID=UPI001AA15B1E|nr:SdpI family protein [Leifsonia sp. TF02-11]MBO1739298.1 SdpI family protein [Leifsonia sp. TF02-11]
MVGVVVGSLLIIVVSALVLWWASASKRGTLRRNHILGYRTRFTLSDDDVWVTVNRAIAPFLFIAGIGAIFGAVVALVVGLIGAPEAGAIVIVVSVAWIFVWLVLTLIPAHARARALKQRTATAR